MKFKKPLFILTFVTLICSLHAQTTLINLGSSWDYFDQESEPLDQGGLDWNDLNYDASSWSSGNAHLGYGDGDEATVVNSNTLTCYFRHEFNVADSSLYGNLDLNLTYDDGAVVYLNGVEVWRVNMPTGTISYNTFSASTSSDNAQASEFISNSLINGNNVLAVEIHQRSTTSSDISFDFKLVANPAGSVAVRRGPYLQKGTSTSMVVRWRTDNPTESIVNYGTSLGSLNQAVSDLTPKTEHEIEVSGLTANTQYFYSIANSSNILVAEASDLYFQTLPTPGTEQAMAFWILGDCGTANNNQRAVRDAYYSYISTGHTDGMLFLGDNAYNDGTDSEYQSAVFENMYEDKLKNTVSWSCLGNHDGHSANSSSQTGPYYDIFSFPTNAESGGLASGTEAYYSFEYGNVHFVSLDSYDSDRSVGGAMYNWCESDLQNTNAEWIVVFWHHPPYSKGSHDSDTESALRQMRENFLPMLEDNGVDLVLSGHSHSYERSYLLNGHYGLSGSFNSATHTVGTSGDGDGKFDGDGSYIKQTTGPDADKGAVYITAGSSGKVSSGSLNHPAMYYSVAALGSCVIEVDGDVMDVKFIRETGTVQDYFTIDKSLTCSPGDPCDDGDPCTSGDVYDAACNCAGVYTDDDGDGYCIGSDPDDNDGCNPDPNSPTCSSCQELANDGFESGFGNWNDGGSNCTRSKSNANSGRYCVQLRDNSGASSSTFTDAFDLSNAEEVNFDFSFYTTSMENGEEFLLEYSTDNGSNYSTHTSWVSGTDFNNNTRYNGTATMSGIAFTDQTRFRFRCNASNKNDKVFIDDIVIESCDAPPAMVRKDKDYLTEANSSLKYSTEPINQMDIKVFPVPTQAMMNVDLSPLRNTSAIIQLFNFEGKIIKEVAIESNHSDIVRIDINGVPAGNYFLNILNQKIKFIPKKIVVVP